MTRSWHGLVVVFLVSLWLMGCAPGAQQRQDVVELYKQGRYAEAVPLAREALEIEEREQGAGHPDVASSLNLLALLHYSLGDYGRAEPLFQRALNIRKNALGLEHPDTATSYNNLGLLYDAMGDFSQAEQYYRRALTIREKVLEADHPDLAASYNNLAGLYYQLGDERQAVALYQKALGIWEKALGPDHPDVASGLDNLAGLYASLGQFDKAEPLYQRALKIREKKLGARHPDVARSLNNLALFYQEQGRYDQAEPLYRRVLEILEKSMGPDHPDLAPALSNLAMLRSSQGDFARAEALIQRVMTILENALGPDHPDVASALDNLAGLYAAQGDYARAQATFKRAQKIDQLLIDQVLGFTSEDKKGRFLATKQASLEASLSLTAQYLAHDPEARRDAYNLWLSRKGIILDTQRRFQDALVGRDDPKATEIYRELSDTRIRLSRLIFAGPGREGAQKFREKIDRLEKKKNEFEAELSRVSRPYALQQRVRTADAAAVARRLEPGSALIEFARVNMFDFSARAADRKWNPPHYLAFVLHSGSDQVSLVDLGPAERIDQAVAGFKKQVINLSDRQGARAMAAATELYRWAFAPLASQVADTQKIYISPDGALNVFPFEVLIGPDARFLVERLAINYLSSGRDLIRFDTVESQGNRIVLIGDPDFNLDASQKNGVLTELGLKAEPPAAVSRAPEMRGFQFGPLPGTRAEVEAIQTIMGPDTLVYTGARALEEVLRQLSSPRILHLATHGFFLSDRQFTQLTGRGRTATKAPAPDVNPLIRSGLALAGANRALASGGSDGILTAEKVLDLKLHGTEMVVLSACETGLGEIRNGEGVYGLRRAFTRAGAQSLVMSMWSVPDRETMELMQNFYTNYQGGMDRGQALRQAVLSQLRQTETRYGHTNPYFWGAFVFMGKP